MKYLSDTNKLEEKMDYYWENANELSFGIRQEKVYWENANISKIV